jgi:hypothetical protein
MAVDLFGLPAATAILLRQRGRFQNEWALAVDAVCLPPGLCAILNIPRVTNRLGLPIRSCGAVKGRATPGQEVPELPQLVEESQEAREFDVSQSPMVRAEDPSEV